MKREKLRRARIKKGLSQQAAAHLIGVSRNTWNLWELGKEDPYPLNVGELCKFFGVKEPSELDLEPSREATEKVPVSAPSHPLSSLLPPQTSGQKKEGEAISQLSQAIIQGVHLACEQLGSQEMNHLRRRLLQLLLGITEEAIVVSSPLVNLDDLAYVLQALKQSSRFDKEAAVSQIEALTEQYWLLLPATSNVVSHDLFMVVDGYLRTLQTLLSGPSHTSAERHISCAISAVAQVAGTMLYVLKSYAQAENRFALAIEFAQRAENEPLEAVALGRIGNFYVDTGKAQKALDPLETANRLAARSATPTIRSWLAASEADAYAHLGRDADCSKALSRAEDHAEQIWTGQDPYHTLFDHPKLEAFKGACYVRLNRPHDASKALACLNTALRQVHSARLIERSTLLRDIAIAHSLDKNIEQACQIASQALAIAEQTHSPNYAQRLQDFSERYLRDWKSTSAVKNFDQHLQTVQCRFQAIASA
jgi:DNA-binding XRE family transcriptional regulator/tetratricopeptide (TPR) repeat protein